MLIPSDIKTLTQTYFDRIDHGGSWSLEADEPNYALTDEALAKEIIRQFLLKVDVVDKVSQGTLYKEDKTSPDMTGLTDPDTGQIIDTTSSDYINNKYEVGQDLYVSIVGLQTDMQDVTFPRGVQDTVVIQGLTVMCPEITSGDVWKDNDADKFYHLKPVKTLASIKRVPILASLQMFELKETAPEYNLS